jgi:hypothetical protein
MKSFTLQSKILGITGLLVALMLLLNGVAFWALHQQRTLADKVARRLTDAIQAHDAIIEALRAYQNQADTIINEITDGKDFAESSQRLGAAIQEFQKQADTHQERALGAEMAQAAAQFTSNYQQEVLPRVSRLTQTQDAQARLQLTRELKAADGAGDAALKKLTEATEKGISAFIAEGDEAKTEYQKTAQRMQVLSAALSVFATLVGAGLALALTRGVSRKVRTIADTLAAGSDQTSSAASQVSRASNSLADGASQQAASVEETSSSLEEMSSMTQRNAANANSAKDLSQQTRTAADTGVAEMQEMSSAMGAIKAASDNIARIIKTIDEIAFQTNILALNAAVEAARAGEAGMGFAVVAEEVRNLAQRSAQAAKETTTLIEDSIQKNERGVQVTARVGQSLQDIAAKARQVDVLVAEIASASHEQSQGINQINLAVTQVDKVTQSNAAHAEETASAAEELSAQAEVLKEAVRELLVLVGSDGQPGLAGAVATAPSRGYPRPQPGPATPGSRPDGVSFHNHSRRSGCQDDQVSAELPN